MPKTESILTKQHQQQDFQSTARKDVAINNRAAPYIALAMGLYENTDNPIQFAIEHLDQIDNLEVLKVYNALEIYADRLGAQQIITLPELARLYGIAKQLSDEKTATAVLISLTARHLAFKSDISHCKECHIDDAKNIIAATKTYFRQEAAMDAMVYMVSSLCKEPDNYQFAATQGGLAELKKLSGAKIFSKQNQDQVNRIRLLLIAAHNIADQVEEKQLDDAYITFTIKQELLKQGIEEKLADAITIVYGASYFFEENYNIPKQAHLEQAAEWLAKSEAIINHKANQAYVIKFLQKYLESMGTVEKAIAAANQLKQDIFSGKPIDGQLKSKGRTAELAWTAFILAQDYAASYYFSPIDGAFKINRNNKGNGLYAAILPGIQYALKEELDNPVHQLTAEQLSKNIRGLLPKSKGIITEQFSNIIRNNTNLWSIPSVFAEELNLLKSCWEQREKLSDTARDTLDWDVNSYLETISTRYIDFVNNNPEIGCDIELKIIAHYYNLQIKQHSHLSDNYGVINSGTKPTAHVFCSLYQGHYHSLVEQKDLKLKDEQFSSSVYIEQAACAAEYEKAENFLEATIGIVSLHNPVVWQANRSVASELLEQKIDEATQRTQIIINNSLEQYGAQVIEEYAQSKLNDNAEKIEIYNRDLILPLIPSEQLGIIDKEAALNIANIEFIAADHQLKHIKVVQSESKFVVAEQIRSVAEDKYSEAEMDLYDERQMVEDDQYVRELLTYNDTMLIKELEALGVANLQAYRAWWQNIIKEQRNSIETTFATVNSQIDKYIAELTKAYEQKLTEIDNHYATVLNRCIQDYYYQQRCIADAKRTAKRKRRQKMTRNFAGMAIAAFVAPYLAGCMFPGAAAAGGVAATAGGAAAAGTAGVGVTAGTVASATSFGCTVATGVIGGAISSAIAGNNVLKGAAFGGLFAGFGFKVDGILGDFIKNSELLKESLSVAATASLSTAIYGGKLLDNILVGVGSNAVASLAIPLPKANSNQALTKQQITATVNRKVMREFTKGMVASLASKNSNFGMSLLMGGMGGLQSWASHQANMYTEQRRAIQQQAATSSNSMAIVPYQQNFKPKLTNTRGGRTGGYWVDLPGIEHPGASAFLPSVSRKLPRREEYYGTVSSSQPVVAPQPRQSFAAKFGNAALDFFMPAAYGDELQVPTGNTFSSSSQDACSSVSGWQRFKENYTTVTNDMDTTDSIMYNSQSREMLKFYDEYNAGTRSGGLLQYAGGGVVLASSLSGLITGGIVPIMTASYYAALGIDNILAGTKTCLTGQHHPTLLNQALRGVGLGDTAAMATEAILNIGPAIPGMAREAVDITKRGMLKLFDLRMASQRSIITGGSKISINEYLANEAKATKMYEEIRLSTTDTVNIAENLKIPKFQAERVKKHVFFVSSSKPRVDTSKLPNTSTSFPSSSSSSSSVQLSRETQKLLGKTDKYKGEFFERPGKTLDQTSLNAAKIELQGKQIDLAIEREISFDHISKIKAAQKGLLRHLNKVHSRLSHPELPMIEREALNTELSNASKLLDYTEQFVPRTTNAPQPPQIPKPKAP